MKTSNFQFNHLARLLGILALAFFTTGFLGIDFGCSDSGGGKKAFTLADGIYAGTAVFEGEEQQVLDSTAPGEAITANSHTEGGGGEYSATTLIGDGRAILFSTEVLDEPFGGDDANSLTSHVGASGKLSLKKVDDGLGGSTFEGSAEGAIFDEGIFDSSLMLFNVVFSDFGHDDHPAHEGEPPFTGPGHPGHLNTDFSTGNGAMGNYDASFEASLYNQVSELEYLANSEGDQYLDQQGAVYVVETDGSFALDAPEGCGVTGQFGIIDEAHNLYSVNLSVTDLSGEDACDETGSYTGLAYATYSAPPGEISEEDDTADTIVLSVTSGEKPGARHITLQLTRTNIFPDSDGDGVPDNLDKCPNTPNGVLVNADGCPLDSDGDGVPDGIDQCPNTLPGVKVNSNGCAIAEPA